MSFLALRDLMLAIGYSGATAWVFPAIIDTAVAVSTMMLVALGDKPARRVRSMTASANTKPSAVRRWVRRAAQGATVEVNPSTPRGGAQTIQAKQAQAPASVHSGGAQTLHASAQASAAQVNAEAAQGDAELALDLIASGATTQPIETVLAVLAATRDGASINAAARASGINYRTAQRIVEAAAERRQRQLVAVG